MIFSDIVQSPTPKISSIVTFSNRFTIKNMTGQFRSDEIAANEGTTLNTTASRIFYCGNATYLCPASAALADLQKATPSTSTSRPRSKSAIIVTVSTLLGGLFVLVCMGLIRRCYRNSHSRKPEPQRQKSVQKWWNKIPLPRYGAAELAGRDRIYTTTELPGDGPRSVYELYAGSIRHDVADGQSDSFRDDQVTKSKHPGSDTIIVTSSTNSEASRALPIREEGDTDESPGESTAMLESTSPSLPEPIQAFDTVTPDARPLSVEGIESCTSAPKVSVPMLSQQELDTLAGAFAPMAPPKPKLSVRRGLWRYG